MATAAAMVPWRPKRYILTGMAMVLAASTVIIATSIILSPSRIHFSIPVFTVGERSNNGVPFHFPIAVHNPGSRTGVKYRDVIVNLQLGRRRVTKKSVPASVDETMPLHQPPGSSMSMSVSGFVETDLSALYFNFSHPDARTNPKVTSTIMVTALVRFNVGLVYSRLYDVRTFCSEYSQESQLDFFKGVLYNTPNFTCSA